MLVWRTLNTSVHVALKSTEKALLRKLGADGLFSEIMQDLKQEGMNWSCEEARQERHLGTNVFAQMVINMWNEPPKIAAIAVTIKSLQNSYTGTYLEEKDYYRVKSLDRFYSGIRIHDVPPNMFLTFCGKEISPYCTLLSYYSAVCFTDVLHTHIQQIGVKVSQSLENEIHWNFYGEGHLTGKFAVHEEESEKIRFPSLPRTHESLPPPPPQIINQQNWDISSLLLY